MKKIFTVIFAALLAASALLVPAKAYEYPVYNGFEYIEMPEENGTLLYAYHGTEKNVVIPQKLGKYNVTAIYSNAFLNNSALQTVTLPSGLKKIEASAFEGCTALKAIHLPKSVTEIANAPFKSCTALESITVQAGNPIFEAQGNCLVNKSRKTVVAGCKNSVIPANGAVTEIDYYAFWGCTGLKSVTVPANITYINPGAFWGCTGLTGVTLQNGLVGMGESAFQGCTALKSIFVPQTVQQVFSNSFYGCTALAEILVSPENTAFYSTNNCLVRRGDSALLMVGLNAEIPTNPEIKTVLYGALSSKLQAEYLYIPANIEVLEPNLLQGFLNLRHIGVARENAFYTVINGCLIEKSTRRLLKACIGAKVPGGGVVTEISSDAFADPALTEIIIPQGVQVVNGYFSNPQLKRLVLPQSVTEAFGICSAAQERTVSVAGYAGTAAEKAAQEYGVRFFALNGCDLTKDGSLDLKDLTLLAQKIAGWGGQAAPLSCDYDGSGQTNLKDLYYLTRLILESN